MKHLRNISIVAIGIGLLPVLGYVWLAWREPIAKAVGDLPNEMLGQEERPEFGQFVGFTEKDIERRFGPRALAEAASSGYRTLGIVGNITTRSQSPINSPRARNFSRIASKQEN